MTIRRALEVRGTVQGVGFRPFVARLARALGLAGHVRNAGRAVVIELEGDAIAISRFQDQLRSEAPAAAHVESVRAEELAPLGERAFSIDESEARGERALSIPPDLATCAECRAEVDDPAGRRHRYPFTNCTACGPRFTIVRELPDDRERTTMDAFPMCERCRAEHDDLGDRRYHAQPIACPTCGPQVRLLDRDGAILATRDAALLGAAEALRRGAIVALQGLGGFQLLCDARDAGVVARLRERKRRPEQPFAVMVADLRAARALARVDDVEARLLESPAAPIVLLPRRGGGVCEGVAPGLARLGLMLPATPLHHLLARAIDLPFVCTSGNLHDEPIATDPDEALARLGPIADALLAHDRAIAHRCDDAVMQVVLGRPRALRLGRGLGPLAIELEGDGVSRLCTGGHLKAAPLVTSGSQAVLWPHVGDLDTWPARAAFAEAVRDMQFMLRVSPREVECDAHPDYASTRWAEASGLPVRRVFHHHAHVAAVLAEHGREEALGFAWDGVGLGPGGAIAGGEVLRVSARGARPVRRLRAFPLPGGDAAARDGRRALAGLLHEADIDPWGELRPFVRLCASPRLAPRTTSAGRLFDAVACLLGVRERSSYEAQAAIALEDLATEALPAYPFGLHGHEIDWRPMLPALMADRDDPVRAASRFHATLAEMIARASEGEPRVVLGGGCFHNARLTSLAVARLRERGVEVLVPERVPAGDGGLALGQAWIASRAELR
ncbi:MAG: carbamoyltransferase HypF [Sandaracinaceae bacterium]|nr:carbamoyltransferase HypF [Sandaracinaceae bacterium]